VESPEVLKVLLEMGAEYGQGYLFQRPEPLIDVAASLPESGARSHVA
jgi:EAL domain-containing protein (putative c-di-GMP-specific phosphodiesterase class I)